jgi:hypothetical protein
VTTDAGAMRLSLDVVGAAVCGGRKAGPNRGWRGKSPAIYFWLSHFRSVPKRRRGVNVSRAAHLTNHPKTATRDEWS